MDPNYHVNRIMQSKAKQQYFVGSSRRQYGSGLGSAIRLGVRAFVLPAIKHYGIPIAKQFLKSAAPEFLDVVQGKTKVKNALKNAAKTTVRKQLGGGRIHSSRKRSKPKKQKKLVRRLSKKKPSKTKSKQRRKRPRKIGTTKKKSKKKSSAKKRAIARGENVAGKGKVNKKSRSRQDFFTSIVDAASA